jgi:hypothetical protein
MATEIPAPAILPTKLAREVTTTAVHRSQNGQRKGSRGESVGVGWRYFILGVFRRIYQSYSDVNQKRNKSLTQECVIPYSTAAVGVV